MRVTGLWFAVNVPVFALAALLYWSGPLAYLVEQDRTMATAGILLIGVVTVLATLLRAIRLDRYIAMVERQGGRGAGQTISGVEIHPGYHGDVTVLERMLSGPHGALLMVGLILVGLGFLFTLVGITQALAAYGAPEGGLIAMFSDPARHAEATGKMLSWLAVAVHTSIAGLTCQLWITAVYMVLESAAERVLLSVLSDREMAAEDAAA